MKTARILSTCSNPRTLFALLLLSTMLTATGCFNLEVGIVKPSSVPAHVDMATSEHAEPTTSQVLMATPTTFQVPMATPTMVALGTEQVARGTIAGWQAFQNKKHGYSFAYPPDCFYGSMPVYCKDEPPKERPPECLCFLSGGNPDAVRLQAYTGEKSDLTLSTFSVYCDGNPDYFNPPPGTELIAWLKEKFSDMHENIPDEPNMEISGVPAVRIYTPQSAQAYSDERIYFIRNDRLFRIQMLNPDAESNRELYYQILSTFRIEN